MDTFLISKQKIRTLHQSVKSSDYLFLVGRDGFEPSKSLTADLQSAPFGHSGTYPYKKTGAGGRTKPCFASFPYSVLRPSYFATKNNPPDYFLNVAHPLRLRVRMNSYKKTGAGGRTRTPDLLITNQLLYQLSYTSLCDASQGRPRSTLEYNITTFFISQYLF